MAAAKEDAKLKAVKEVIEGYSDTVDNYIRSDIEKVAKAKMDEGGTPAEVADAVYDFIYEKHFGDDTMAAASMQLFPKRLLPILRSDIIKALG